MSQSPDKLVGKRVKWPLSGAGRGREVSGIVLKYVPPGTTNGEAIIEIRDEMPRLRIKRSYLRFSTGTHSTHRYIVAVKTHTGAVWPKTWFYAPNISSVEVVS